MSKARDELEKMDFDYMRTTFCDESVFHYNVMQLRDKYREVVSELEAEKAELIELIADINRRIKSGSFNIPMYENYYMSDVEKLLQRCKIGGQGNE